MGYHKDFFQYSIMNIFGERRAPVTHRQQSLPQYKRMRAECSLLPLSSFMISFNTHRARSRKCVPHLEDIELQVIGILIVILLPRHISVGPEDRMIGGLGAELHLP